MEKQTFNDEEVKILVFYFKASNQTVGVPMKWKNMKDFIRDQIVGKVGVQKGMLSIYSTEAFIDGIDDKQTIEMVDLESVAGWRIADVQKEDTSEADYRRDFLAMQKKYADVLERLARMEQGGEAWKLCKSSDTGQHLLGEDSRKCLHCGEDVPSEL